MSPQQIWLAYVDREYGCDRENWSVFYCEPLVAFTKKAVEDAAKLEVTKRATMDCDGDLTDLEYFENSLHIHIVGPLPMVPS